MSTILVSASQGSVTVTDPSVIVSLIVPGETTSDVVEVLNASNLTVLAQALKIGQYWKAAFSIPLNLTQLDLTARVRRGLITSALTAPTFRINYQPAVTTTPAPTVIGTGTLTWNNTNVTMANSNVGSTITGSSTLVCAGGSRSYNTVLTKSANITLTGVTNQTGTLQAGQSIVVTWTAVVNSAGAVNVTMDASTTNGSASFNGTAVGITTTTPAPTIVTTTPAPTVVGGLSWTTRNTTIPNATVGSTITGSSTLVCSGAATSYQITLTKNSNISFTNSTNQSGTLQPGQSVVVSWTAQVVAVGNLLVIMSTDTNLQSTFTGTATASTLNEIITFNTLSAVGGTPVTINITGGQPSSNFTITNELSGVVFPRTLDSSGNFTLQTVVISAAEQGFNTIVVPLRFTFADGSSQLFYFTSNSLPVTTYNEVVTVNPASAFGGVPVDVTVTGGPPNSNFTITNQLSGVVFPRTLDSSGNFTLQTVVISAAEQGQNIIYVPLNFSFSDGNTRSVTFASYPNATVAPGYTPAISFSTLSAVSDTPVTITVTGGEPNSNFTITNQISGVQFPRTLNGNGSFTLQTVIMSAAEQPPFPFTIPLRFTFSNGFDQTFNYVSNP